MATTQTSFRPIRFSLSNNWKKTFTPGGQSNSCKLRLTKNVAGYLKQMVLYKQNSGKDLSFYGCLIHVTGSRGCQSTSSFYEGWHLVDSNGPIKLMIGVPGVLIEFGNRKL